MTQAGRGIIQEQALLVKSTCIYKKMLYCNGFSTFVSMDWTPGCANERFYLHSYGPL